MLAPLLSSMSTISQCPFRLAMNRGDAPSYTSKINGCFPRKMSIHNTYPNIAIPKLKVLRSDS